MAENISEETRLYRQERRKEKKRRGKIRKLKNTAWLIFKFCIVLILPVYLLVTGFDYFQGVELNETERVYTSIENAELRQHRGGQGHGNRTWFDFSTSVGQCYCLIPDDEEKIELFENLFEEKEKSGEKILISVSDIEDRSAFHLIFHSGTKQIVDLRAGEKVYISIDDYNDSLKDLSSLNFFIAAIYIIVFALCGIFAYKSRRYMSEYKKHHKKKRK